MIATNEVDHGILGRLKQQRERPENSGLNGDSKPDRRSQVSNISSGLSRCCLSSPKMCWLNSFIPIYNSNKWKFPVCSSTVGNSWRHFRLSLVYSNCAATDGRELKGALSRYFDTLFFPDIIGNSTIMMKFVYWGHRSLLLRMARMKMAFWNILAQFRSSRTYL